MANVTLREKEKEKSKIVKSSSQYNYQRCARAFVIYLQTTTINTQQCNTDNGNNVVLHPVRPSVSNRMPHGTIVPERKKVCFFKNFVIGFVRIVNVDPAVS